MFDDLKEKSYIGPNGMDVVADLREAIERLERERDMALEKLARECAARQRWIAVVDEWQALAELAEDVAWRMEKRERKAGR